MHLEKVTAIQLAQIVEDKRSAFTLIAQQYDDAKGVYGSLFFSFRHGYRVTHKSSTVYMGDDEVKAVKIYNEYNVDIKTETTDEVTKALALAANKTK